MTYLVHENESQALLDRYKASFKSPATAKSYCYHLLTYCNDLIGLLDMSQKEAEEKLIDFIIKKKKEGMNYGYLHNFVAAVSKLYKINGIFLNKDRINMFMPEPTKQMKDRPYTINEISSMLGLANERIKTLILLLSSGGIRLGVIPKLKISDLQDKGDIYKITVYPNTRQEYYTYCTPECKKALDLYLAIRKRHGEVITGKSPVIREQYNKRDPLRTKHPRFLSRGVIIKHLYTIMETAGIRTRIHGIRNAKHDVMLVHGFRKFFNTQLGDNGINLLIKEMLMGHKVGMEKTYYKPTEEKVYQEYLRAIPFLTIDQTNILEKQLEEKTEQSEIDLVKLRNKQDVQLLLEENKSLANRLSTTEKKAKEMDDLRASLQRIHKEVLEEQTKEKETRKELEEMRQTYESPVMNELRDQIHKIQKELGLIK